jgi:hypothetical protein
MIASGLALTLSTCRARSDRMIMTWTSMLFKRRRISRNTRIMPLMRKEDSLRILLPTIDSMMAREISSMICPITITKELCFLKQMRGDYWKSSRWSWKTSGERSALHNMQLKALFAGKKDWVAKISKTLPVNYGSYLKTHPLDYCR